MGSVGGSQQRAAAAGSGESGARSTLVARGVPESVIQVVLGGLSDADRGLLLYGSRARGDAVEGSDWDFLALTTSPRSSSCSDTVSLSYYTEDQLSAGIGTLFGVHLARDGLVLWDPSGEISKSLAHMGTLDTAHLFERARRMSIVLGCLERDLPRYLKGLLREARYLLRSCLYGTAIASGAPCFSVRELARRYDAPELERLLASRHDEPPSEADLRDCVSRLEELIGPLPVNPHGSLEALIVNEWYEDEDVISMAMMALDSQDAEAGYIELKKVLL